MEIFLDKYVCLLMQCTKNNNFHNFINKLLCLKVLVVNLQFYLLKRCHKMSYQAEAYVYAIIEVQVATKEDTFHNECQRSLNLSYALMLHCCRM